MAGFWLNYLGYCHIVGVELNVAPFPVRTSDSCRYNNIGTSSLLAMLVRDQSIGHSAWNQSWFQRAPQPHDPEALEKTWLKIWVRCREVPCHLSKKVCHHVRLERNSWFSLIQFSRCGLEEANVIILLRNVPLCTHVPGYQREIIILVSSLLSWTSTP